MRLFLLEVTTNTAYLINARYGFRYHILPSQSRVSQHTGTHTVAVIRIISTFQTLIVKPTRSNSPSL